MGMVFIKSNNWYYKPGSQPAAGVGGSCNRGLLRYKNVEPKEIDLELSLLINLYGWRIA